jgi:carbohydrate-binding DOMON domain-containing protein
MRRGPPDLSSTARRFAFPIQRIRYGTSTVNADGYTVRGSTTASSILAHVYPAPGEVLERLPEGYEGRDVVMGTTIEELTLGTETTRADVIVYSGKQYEVFQVSPRATGRNGTRTWREFMAAEVQR